MKTKCALSIAFALIIGVVPAQSSSNVVNYPSAAVGIGHGNESFRKQDYEKARRYYNAAIAQDPTAWAAYMNRAWVFIQQRKWNLALQDLNNVVRLKSGHLGAALLRGRVNALLGNYSRALDEYDRLVKITHSELPSICAAALNNRAWLRATCPNASFRNGRQAVADANSACNRASWSEPAYIDTLAAAYAETGHFDSAIRFEQQVISQMEQALVRSIQDPDRRRAVIQSSLTPCQRRLAAYQRHQPWRSNLD